MLGGEIRSWFDCESTASVNRSLLLRVEGMPSAIWDTGDEPKVSVNRSLTKVTPQLFVTMDLFTMAVQLLKVQGV